MTTTIGEVMDRKSKLAVAGDCLKDAVIALLEERCERDIKCCWLTTNRTPGTGCCDAVLVRNVRYENTAPVRLQDCVANREAVFEVKVTRCKPAVEDGKDTLSPGQEAELAMEIMDEREALLDHLLAYLAQECNSCETMSCAKAGIGRIQSYDDDQCTGSSFQVTMVIGG